MTNKKDVTSPVDKVRAKLEKDVKEYAKALNTDTVTLTVYAEIDRKPMTIVGNKDADITLDKFAVAMVGTLASVYENIQLRNMQKVIKAKGIKA